MIDGMDAMQNRIKQFREHHRMTQEELAELAGVSRQTIISLEKSKYTASFLLARKLSKIFNVLIEELFIFENEENES
jgi:putative transcriptional regulator